MAKPPQAEYCIEINFEKGTTNPSRIFRSMSELIDTFHIIDQSLVKCIASQIDPVLVLEDIEIGSIKTWLRNVLNVIDDDALKGLDWRPQVGKYLVKGKYAMIDFLEGKTSISDIKEIKPLAIELNRLARDTNVLWLPAYKPIEDREILEGLQSISGNLSYLQEGDRASYITDDNKVGFNLEFKFAPESLEELYIKEKVVSSMEMILKVKKPDYLGESMWEFRHGTRNMPARVSDVEWLEQFQNRKVQIQPGDSIRAIVQIINKLLIDLAHLVIVSIKSSRVMVAVEVYAYSKRWNASRSQNPRSKR